MKFCEVHWSALRAAIDRRGLAHLVARDGKAALERVVDEIVGDATDATFDPLMAAHWAILSRVISTGALYIMSVKPDGGDYCPLCEVEIHTGPGAPPCQHPGEAQKWIEGCTDMILKTCREKKLVPGVQ